MQHSAANQPAGAIYLRPAPFLYVLQNICGGQQDGGQPTARLTALESRLQSVLGPVFRLKPRLRLFNIILTITVLQISVQLLAHDVVYEVGA